MDYKGYIFKKKEKKNYFKIAWKIFKILLFLFLLISLLWGCGMMFSSKFNVYEINDVSGQQVYKPGVFFEILVGIDGGKQSFFHIVNGHVYEYPYNGISTWSEAFTVTQSPFYGCFVYPIAALLSSIINAFPGGVDNGFAVLFSIILTSLIIRLITLMFSFKSQMNQDKMSSVQIKQAEITAKYKNSSDPAAKQKQQMETMQLYKKEGVSPAGAFSGMILTIPFLIAMYTVIKTSRILKIATIGQISLIDKPWTQITEGNLIYLVLLVVYLPLQVLSMILPNILNSRRTKVVTKEQKKAKKKQYIIQGVMSVLFLFFAISVAAGVAIYWIFSAFFQILQTLLFYFIRKHKKEITKFQNDFSQKFKKLFIKKEEVYSTGEVVVMNKISSKKTETKLEEIKSDNLLIEKPIKQKPKNTKKTVNNNNKKKVQIFDLNKNNLVNKNNSKQKPKKTETNINEKEEKIDLSEKSKSENKE
ncbi:membrane protein insertase YidC [Spiroplasma endosymbiont of Amphibalanus improvisus]|uniref:membrane protein insertase YidC n=1 Tax=Spiroplasma endosymbiont of Amphibalanus improvisus TaxID=3066327 RepID=UPI00313CF423